MSNGEHQAAHNGSGDAAALQESTLADDEATQNQQQHGDGSSLVHVQCDGHVVFSFFLSKLSASIQGALMI
jgi:hypothetical protein